MGHIEDSFFTIKKLDALSYLGTPVHRLDPRMKVVTTLVYIIIIVSFNRYHITGLLPFFFYPVFLIFLGNIPPLYLLKKVVFVSPFALIIALFNLFLDRTLIFTVYSFSVTGGMISFISIMIRFVFTVLTAFTLIAVTGFVPMCFALTKIGVPSMFALQLLFLYRYIYVLIEESIKMVRAHHVRAFSNKIKLKTFGSIIGHLLLRTINRAERIHTAMLSRGFHGKLHMNRELKIRKSDIFFISGWIIFFITARLYDLPVLLGKLITGWKV